VETQQWVGYAIQPFFALLFALAKWHLFIYKAKFAQSRQLGSNYIVPQIYGV